MDAQHMEAQGDLYSNPTTNTRTQQLKINAGFMKIDKYLQGTAIQNVTIAIQGSEA